MVETADLDCNTAWPGGGKLASCWRSVLETVGKKTGLMDKFTAELQGLQFQLSLIDSLENYTNNSVLGHNHYYDYLYDNF